MVKNQVCKMKKNQGYKIEKIWGYNKSLTSRDIVIDFKLIKTKFWIRVIIKFLLQKFNCYNKNSNKVAIISIFQFNFNFKGLSLFQLYKLYIIYIKLL